VREILARAFYLPEFMLKRMFCPKCGAQNAEGVSYCEKCGNPMQSGGFQQPTYTPMSGSSNRARKSPIVAAILNLFFGLGYMYLGYNKVLGIPTFGFVVGMLVVFALVGFLSGGLISLVLAVVLAIDGYQKGQGQKGFISAE
jgi:ribosomal protein L37AE/L43A